MKKNVLFLLAGLVIIAFSCTQITELTPEEQIPSGPVTITVNMDPETKATLAEETGAFAFSSGDAIKIFNGSSVYTGTTTSTANSGSFTMEEGFTAGSGFAGFPASMVSSIDGNGVVFTLPDKYAFEEVGSTNADAAKVPCPMIGTYTAGNSISLKQAGAVIRFRITNVAAGSLVFIFPTNVTGTTNALTTPASASDKGILASNLTGAGYLSYQPKNSGYTYHSLANNTITVIGVPNVENGNYIYITLPVPAETKPQNITVMNVSSSSDNNRKAILTGVNEALSRAGGHKMGVTLDLVSPTNLSNIPDADYTAKNGETLTGILNVNRKISIEPGATVVLDGVTINGTNNSSYKWAGINCEGNATIILSGSNSVKGFYDEYPGIIVAIQKTLTILGTGSLEAKSSGWASGIGGGYNKDAGFIVLKGGDITATGGSYSTGIGGGSASACYGICVTDGVISVKATRGSNSGLNSIGNGAGKCGPITFGTEQVYDGDGATATSTWMPDPMVAGNYGGLSLAISGSTWTLTPVSQ